MSGLFGSLGMIFEMHWAWRFVPGGAWFFWARGAAIAWAICSCGMIAALALVRRVKPRHDPGRRMVLRAAQTAVVAAPDTITEVTLILFILVMAAALGF